MANSLKEFIAIIRKNICADYGQMYRQSGKGMKYPFLTPGCDQYADVLWDWDSWLSNIALRQILKEVDDPKEYEKAKGYERGCIQNFLSGVNTTGWMPIAMGRGEIKMPENVFSINMHKPCLAQHAAFLVKEDGGNAEWLREQFQFLQFFINNYRNHHRHSCGIYFWQTDSGIGVDNDPCTYSRPQKSSGSIYLNSLMYRELLATVYLCKQLKLDEIANLYQKDADNLKKAIQEFCWDEWLGFFYSVDLNLEPVPTYTNPALHMGQPRDWPCLIQRIGVWSGFLALWAEIATQEQAERVVKEHYNNQLTFNAPFGVRTLSKAEKMYNLRASGNPSSWLGPIWGISNYLTFRALVKYGFKNEAVELAEKTIRLFGRDFEQYGALHEYYQPENGEPILNRGFQNWNYLVLNMTNWIEGKNPIEEF